MKAIEREEAMILGAIETIKTLFADFPEKRQLLKKTFPYLSEEEIEFWGNYHRI
jgi:hypothetical protein